MRSNPLVTALFWAMFLVGGGSLAAGLYLPVWLENRALNEQLAGAQQRAADLDARLTALDVRLEHLKSDPAYVERLARKELGIPAQGRETVLIDSAESSRDGSPAQDAAPPLDRKAQIESAIETAARTHPVVSLYLRAESRPVLMGMSLALMLAALALLGRSALSTQVQPAQ